MKQLGAAKNLQILSKELETLACYFRIVKEHLQIQSLFSELLNCICTLTLKSRVNHINSCHNGAMKPQSCKKSLNYQL